MKVDTKFPSLIEARSDKLAQVQFDTPSAFREWVNSQNQFYTKLLSPIAGSDHALNQIWQTTNNIFQNIIQQIDQANQNPKADQKHYQAILNQFVEHFSAQRLFEANSATAQFLSSLAASDTQIAARVFAILSTPSFNLQPPLSAKWLQAGAITVGWLRGWVNEVPVDASLNALQTTWDERFVAQQEAFRSGEAELNKRITAVDAIRANWEKHLKDLQGQSSDLHKALTQDGAENIANAEKRLADFTSAYNQALALRAPTQYWRDKQRGHRAAAGWWFAAFATSAAIAVVGVWFVWHITVELHIAKDASPPYTVFIPSIGAALLATWFMRMFSRQLISNLSLSADAGERVAMVKTYLALTEGGHAKDGDRGLILAALFRPSWKSGDDAAPPSALDLLSKLMKSDK